MQRQVVFLADVHGLRRRDCRRCHRVRSRRSRDERRQRRMRCQRLVVVILLVVIAAVVRLALLVRGERGVARRVGPLRRWRRAIVTQGGGGRRSGRSGTRERARRSDRDRRRKVFGQREAAAAQVPFASKGGRARVASPRVLCRTAGKMSNSDGIETRTRAEDLPISRATYLFQHNWRDLFEVFAEQLVEHEHNAQYWFRFVVRLQVQSKTARRKRALVSESFDRITRFVESGASSKEKTGKRSNVRVGSCRAYA